jgi:hypothetical protein
MPTNSFVRSIDLVPRMIERLLGFYSKIPAREPQIFMTGMIELMAIYPTWVVERLPSAVNGIPSLCKFCPQVSEVKEICDGWVLEKQRSDDLLTRYLPKPAAADRHVIPPRNNTSPAVLCERFGIKAIPCGWDAVEVTRQAARYGASFPAYVEKLLREPNLERAASFASVMSDKIRVAMERRREGLTPELVAE